MAYDELLELVIETNKLSNHIGKLKRQRNRLEEGLEKKKLQEEIKILQYQTLFCLEKMENLNNQLETDCVDC